MKVYSDKISCNFVEYILIYDYNTKITRFEISHSFQIQISSNLLRIIYQKLGIYGWIFMNYGLSICGVTLKARNSNFNGNWTSNHIYMHIKEFQTSRTTLDMNLISHALIPIVNKWDRGETESMRNCLINSIAFCCNVSSILRLRYIPKLN